MNKFAPNVPGPGTIITATLGLCTTLLIAIAAVGTSVVGVGNSSLAMVLVYVLILVFSIGMYMAIKVFMLTLELGLVVMLSPLSFSFLGLNALKDQGIAPLKSLISLVYRIILLGIIYAAFGEVISVAGKQLNDISWFNPLQYATGINIIFSMICAFPMLAYLVYKSDSIAASLAGGSSSMGPGDVASAAAMGAAAGAAAASGGVSAMGAATKPVQSMANFMQGLRGGGSVSNASSQGMGGSTSSLPLSPPPVASLGSGSSASGGPAGPAAEAAAPAFETNKAGAPMNPDPNAQVASPAEASGGSKAPSPGSSGSSAALIGAADSPQQGTGYKKTLGDNLSNLGHHMSQEKAATHVSINTHHSD